MAAIPNQNARSTHQFQMFDRLSREAFGLFMIANFRVPAGRCHGSQVSKELLIAAAPDDDMVLWKAEILKKMNLDYREFLAVTGGPFDVLQSVRDWQ
jgi:hypothetical protein